MGRPPQNYFMNKMDLFNIVRTINIKMWKMHELKEQSIRMYTEAFPSRFSVCQEQNRIIDKHFILGIQTEWQTQKMLELGNKQAICIDDTFGTNN